MMFLVVNMHHVNSVQNMALFCVTIGHALCLERNVERFLSINSYATVAGFGLQ